MIKIDNTSKTESDVESIGTISESNVIEHPQIEAQHHNPRPILGKRNKHIRTEQTEMFQELN